MTTRALLSLSIVACGLAAQDRPARCEGWGGNAIVGTVLDASGKPVAGASISVERAFGSRYDGAPACRDAAEHQLRWTPLPEGVTAADGGFNLPLTRDQARLGIVGGIALALVVEKEGFRSCRLPIGTCPGRVGRLAIRLDPGDPKDRIEGVITVPQGMTLPKGRVDVVYDMSRREDAFSMCTVEMDGGASFSVPRVGDIVESSCRARNRSVRPYTVGFHVWPSFEGFSMSRTSCPLGPCFRSVCSSRSSVRSGR